MEVAGLTVRMPALAALAEPFAREQPFARCGVLLHMHLTPETIALGQVLAEGGASVVFAPSNKNPSRLEALAAARSLGTVVEGLSALDAASAAPRDVWAVEGNGSVFAALHAPDRPPFLDRVRGISEHTSGGGRRVDAHEPGELRVPVVAVYRDALKTSVETGLGTSQTVAAALIRSLGPLAGLKVAVVGFGHVGRGVSSALRTLGARVTVVEIAPEAALRARLEGLAVGPLEEALAGARLCVTTTGRASSVTPAHLEHASDGLVLANVGNVAEEIDLTGCRAQGEPRGHRQSFTTPSGKSFDVLAGRIQVNHVVEKGNPSELMDASFTLHALALRWLVEARPPPGVYAVPEALRRRASELLLGGLE